LLQFDTLGRLHPLKARLAARITATRIHTVEQQHMKVNIEIERTAKALDECHRAGTVTVTGVRSMSLSAS
jgi:hypothetical protein